MKPQPIRLKALREEKGLRQKDLADFYGVSLDYLLGRSDQRK